MRVLITNIQLDHRTGTEIVVRDLEAALRQRGHTVCVYTERPGLLSDEIAANGGQVVASVDDVPFVPDVIHGHHSTPATAAALKFPATPLILVCHSRSAWFDIGPGVPSVRRYVAVDLSCRERLVAEGISGAEIEVITNAVDLERFTVRSHCAGPPRRAAIFANNARSDGGFASYVRSACHQLGLSLDEFGVGVGNSLRNPEDVLASYDLVFAKARCAIEALAAGCAVVAIDDAGYGGLVTAATVDLMLDWNVGDRCLQRKHDLASIVADIGRVDADDAAAVSSRVRARCDLRSVAKAYEDLYRVAIHAQRSASSPPATWHDVHVAVLTYANELEDRLRFGEGTWSMPPLPPTAGKGLELVVNRPPGIVSPSDRFSIDVEVRNRSRELLATVGRTPVALSYHWLHGDTGAVAIHDGERTALTRTVVRGQDHRQSMEVVAPERPARYILRVTMVQETVAWFSDLADPVFVDLPISVRAEAGEWRLSDIATLVDVSTSVDAMVGNLGFVSTPLPDMLTFATTSRFLDDALRTGCSAVIVPPALTSSVRRGIGLVVADDPAALFWQLHERLAAGTDFYGRDEPNTIHPSARVHPSAAIGECNVRIGARSSIGPGCVITGRIDIGDRVSIGAGAVLGATGFQTVGVDGRLVELSHVGGVVIGDDVAVLANATIAAGLFRQATVLQASARVGNNAVVSHNCRIGQRSVIGHGAVVNGNVAVGADVWIGPGSTVANNLALGDGVRIDIGATVIGSLSAGEHVGGPPAIDHNTVLREVASWRSRRRRGS